MGEFAGHERRGSLIWPGRSAVIGLMGAALGLRRDGDFSSLEALSMAVAIFDAGDVLRDFHTIESVPSAAVKRPQSRPAALRAAGGKANTTITLRDYRTAPFYGIAVWGGDLAPLAEALRTPVFSLYLGRKSCPLAAPLDPQIVAADTPDAALQSLRMPPWRRGAAAQQMARDGGTEGASVTRYDRAIDRQAWHFAPRQVTIQPVDIRPGDAQ